MDNGHAEVKLHTPTGDFNCFLHFMSLLEVLSLLLRQLRKDGPRARTVTDGKRGSSGKVVSSI